MEAMFAQQTVTRLQKAQDMFKRFDTDNSGTISHDEFIQALDSFGLNLSFDASKKMLDSFDSNGDGVVSLEEFTEHFMKFLNSTGLGGGGAGQDPATDDVAALRAQLRKLDAEKANAQGMQGWRSPEELVNDFRRKQRQKKVLRRDWGTNSRRRGGEDKEWC